MMRAVKGLLNTLLRPFHIELRSRFSGGRLFPESFAHLKRVLPPLGDKKATLIDVGVADGTPELWAAFPHTEYRHLLLEANPLYAEVLTAKAQEMGAILEKVFCGDHDGTESFIPRTDVDGGKASKYDRKTGMPGARVEVPCMKLDTIIAKHTLPGPYILKIDVEGAELDVLRGAEAVLKKTEAVIVEAPVILRKRGASSFAAIVHHLHERGFAVFDIAEMSYHRQSGFLNLTNLIFVRSDNPRWEQKSVFAQ